MPDFTISIRNKAAFYPDRYGYQRRGTIPTSIVVHSTEGVKGQSFASASNYLYRSAAVSAHFLVGRDGFIEQQLSPKTIQAWHAGEARYGFGNAQSIGIELLHKSGEDWPAIQKDALAWLLRRLMTDHAIPSSRIETHGQIAIPGPYVRKTDPTNWPYADFRAWVAALVPDPPDPPTLPRRVKGVPIYQRKERTGPLAGHLAPGDLVTIDAVYGDGGGHLADGRGFVDLNALD